MPPLTPGAYLKYRRTAAMLGTLDLAELLPTDPATPPHVLAQQIELIEADAQPLRLSTIIALRAVFSFDLDVLGQLEAIRQGLDVPAPQLCRICACSQHDGCEPICGRPCGWAEVDLCTVCASGALLGRVRSIEPARAVEAVA